MKTALYQIKQRIDREEVPVDLLAASCPPDGEMGWIWMQVTAALGSVLSASGVEVDVECKSSFLDIKLGHKYRYITFTLSSDLTKIIIQKVADPDATYDEFVKDMRAAQDASECRYAVYDMPYRNHDGQQRTKLIFFMWSPEEATVKQKMVYSSSKDALKKALGEGISREIQANDMGDLNLDSIMEVITRSERR